MGKVLVAVGVACLAAVLGWWAPWKASSTKIVKKKNKKSVSDESEDRLTLPSIRPSDLSQKWWNKGGGVSFESEHVIQINTLNFNSTVTNAKKKRVLIAFYDPRSESFKALRKDLDQTANSLAKSQQAGEPIGYLGACDATQQTFLGVQQASELQSGWQQSANAAVKADKGGFKFGRPRFYPLILILYRDGKRVGEYTGVVSPKAILHYMRLQKRKVGGSDVPDEKKLTKFLNGPGPIALACGLVNGTLEHTAFKQTANDYHGKVAFGIVPLEVCTKRLQQELTGPTVVWVRGDGATLSGERNMKLLANESVASNATLLADWLTSFKADILEEITPDNSHVFLERDSPSLAMVLLDKKDAAGRSKAEGMFEPVEKELRRDFNLVWANCAEFASQFQVPKKNCPALVVVQPHSLDFQTNTLKNLTSGSGSPSSQLTKWMFETNAYKEALQFKDWMAEHEKNISNAENATGATETSTTQDFSQKEEEKPPETGRYEDQMQGRVLGGTPDSQLADYHSTLGTLYALKTSYEKRYSHIPLDFSPLDKIQQRHHALKKLVKNEVDVLSKIHNITRLTWLWGAVEKRDNFSHWLSTTNFTKLEEDKRAGISDPVERKRVDVTLREFNDFEKVMKKGFDTLTKLFKTIFSTLHKHADQGSLGVPKASPHQIPRRDASELSVQEFFDEYARPAKPVIVTGLNITEEEPWTLDFFKRRCFNKTVELRQYKEHSRTWGRLQTGGQLPINEFIDTFTTNETRSDWYLHDWSLPRSCPEVFGAAPFGEFTVPRYFAGDYFQRAGFEGYQHTWPSLFIGSNKTLSQMHIDSGNTNFWLYLLSGRKVWRLYSRDDLVNVYKSMSNEHFWLDPFDLDPKRFPLAEYAVVEEAVQEAGELIFIPGGNPHAVKNLEHIHGVSMNYADASNVARFLLDQITVENWNTVEMFTDGSTLPSGLRSEQEPLRFGEWKSVPWHKLKYDIQLV